MNTPPETTPLIQRNGFNIHSNAPALPRNKKPSSITSSFLQPGLKEASWQQKVAFYIDTTSIGRVWELSDAILNILFCGIYITNTFFYLNGATLLPFGYQLADVLCALFLLIQFIPRLFISADFWRFFVSPLNLLSFVCTIPVFLAILVRNDENCTKEYMCADPSKTSILKLSIITRKAIRLVGFLLCLILTVAAFVHLNTVMNNKTENISFFDAFYFAFVSALSGSPSQIIPDSKTNRYLVVGVIIAVLMFVPANLAELLNLISKKSVYEHSYKRKQNHNHVVLCGKFETASLQTFLREFFCTDHGTSSVNTHIVLLQPHEPTEDMKIILTDPAYVNRVQYVLGTVMEQRSLEKVRIQEAKACFLLSSKYVTSKASEEDANSVMRALALKKTRKDIPLHVQVLLPEHKSHFEHLADTMMCVDELKLGMLAQSCRCPGFTTLINILTTTTTEKHVKNLLGCVEDGSSQEWIKEYLEGVNQEIYPTVLLSEGYRGIPFLVASRAIYEQFGCVLFGLGIPNNSYVAKQMRKKQFDSFYDTRLNEAPQRGIYDSINASDFDLFLNPGDYVLQGGELAFVIGSKDEVTKQVAEFNLIEFLQFDVVLNIGDEKSKKSKMKRKYLRNHRIVDRRQASIHHPINTPDEIKKKVSETEPELFPTVETHKMPRMTGRKAFTEVPSPQGSDGNLVMMKDLSASGTSKALPQDVMSDLQDLTIDRQRQFNRDSKSSASNLKRHTRSASDSEASAQTVKKDALDSMNFVSRILQQAMGLHGNYARDSALSLLSKASSSPTSHSLEARSMIEEDLYPRILPDEVNNHFLICDSSDTFPSNLEYFIAPLRFSEKSRNADKDCTPIVVLSPADPDEFQKSMLQKFDNVFVIKGNPMIRKDLARAGVRRCAKAVVLANASKGKGNPERISDSSSLLMVLNIEAMSEKEDLFVISEFIHEENITFVGQSEIQFRKLLSERYGKALMRPAFMSGHVYCQAMLDTVICQNFFNPHMLNIVRHLLFSGSFKTDNSISSAILKPVHSHIWMIPVPNVLIGTCFLDLFAYLITEHKAVPIALYRRTQQKRSALSPITTNNPNYLKGRNVFSEVYERVDVSDFTECASNYDRSESESDDFIPHHYVYVNPAPECVIQEHDHVYLLSVDRPKLFNK